MVQAAQSISPPNNNSNINFLYTIPDEDKEEEIKEEENDGV